MKILYTLSRILLIAFLSVTLIQYIKHPQESVKQFQKNYKQFEASLQKKFKIKLPQCLTTNKISTHLPLVLQILTYTILAISLLCLLVSSRFTFLLGLLYYIQQVIHKDMTQVPKWNDVDRIKEIALVHFVFFASIALSHQATCYNKKVVQINQQVIQ